MWRSVALLLLTVPLIGAGKPAVVYQYQDATLVSFRDVVVGANCSSDGSTEGTISDSGNVRATSNGSTSCSNRTSRQYTVQVGVKNYVLQMKPPITARLPVAWMFTRDSVLANLLPGTPIKVRTDEHGFYVKVGKKESAFTIVAAQ